MSATVPFHSTCFAGSVRKGQIVSGVASMTISRMSSAMSVSPSLAVFGGFGDVAQALEPGRPVLIEEGAQVGHGAGVGPVQATGALTPFGHEVGLLQDAEVLGDGRAR